MSKLRHFSLEVVEDDMAVVFREMSHAQRLGVAFGLWRSTSRMLTSMLRSQHPDWDAKRISTEVARRLSHGSI